MVQAETGPEALAAVFDDLLKLRQASKLTNQEPEYGPGLEEASVMILKLRALLRSKCEETEELREQTAAARSTLDQSSLKLKNLAYENDHYSKEIHACLSFQYVLPGEAQGLDRGDSGRTILCTESPLCPKDRVVGA